MADNTNTGTNRRRSSASERFASLQAHKRDAGNERASAARASFSDQRPAPGFLGKMWNDFTRGPATTSNSNAAGAGAGTGSASGASSGTK
ncbi:conidiation-specific protein [Diplodia corticola]|uniref:Conidiation-specific protein n=1 Tax=Diplodia corticola TaxID=236234 RepID=A0A1J9RUB5_9PEZI|nr:conidiation-specific protein [Diplodia corticola]OJD31101.1 conidiation-specific protein [Diplodia corticola]